MHEVTNHEEKPTGKWIPFDEPIKSRFKKCSVCGAEIVSINVFGERTFFEDTYHFCYNCGTPMKGE